MANSAALQDRQVMTIITALVDPAARRSDPSGMSEAGRSTLPQGSVMLVATDPSQIVQIPQEL